MVRPAERSHLVLEANITKLFNGRGSGIPDIDRALKSDSKNVLG